MKKIIIIFIFFITLPLFSEQIHFRLVNNQDKYDFISNSEFYFDTQTDTFGVYNNYDFEYDELACGIMMYILLTGYPPFMGEDEEKIFQNILIFNKKNF